MASTTKKKRRFIYRDSYTGKFIRKSTWQRSKAQGGTRYRREAVRPKAPPPPSVQIYEWLVTFTYVNTGKSFDVIVTAENEQDALLQAEPFRPKAGNWQTRAARGPEVSARRKPELRSESKKDS